MLGNMAGPTGFEPRSVASSALVDGLSAPTEEPASSYAPREGAFPLRNPLSRVQVHGPHALDRKNGGADGI